MALKRGHGFVGAGLEGVGHGQKPPGPAVHRKKYGGLACLGQAVLVIDELVGGQTLALA